MGTLTIKVSSGNLESYEALFLQLTDPGGAGPVERVELHFGQVTQVFPSAFALVAAYVARTRDRSRRPIVSRLFGANPQSAKLERAMDAMGFVPALAGSRTPPRPAGGVVPLHAIDRETTADQTAARVLDAILQTAQPTRDVKECLFVALTEIVENVLLHSGSDGPAYLCGQLSAQKRRLELCIADAGVGLRRSFEDGKDAESLRRLRGGESPLRLALAPGVTSKGDGHTGFGLHVASIAARLNGAAFRLTSGDETWLHSKEGEKHRTHARWEGTVVNFLFNLNQQGALAEVYRTLPLALPEGERLLADGGGRGGDAAAVALRGEGPYPYLGSRDAAARVRARLLETVRAGGHAVADADGVLAMTPGYANECFGELLAALGEEAFRSSVSLRNANESTRLLVEAVLQRRARPRESAEREEAREARPAGAGATDGAPEPPPTEGGAPSGGGEPAHGDEPPRGERE